MTFSLLVWAASFAIGFERSLGVLMLTGLLASIVGLRRPALGLFGIAILCTLDSVARSYLLTGGLWRYNTFNYWLLIVMILWLPFLLRLRDSQMRILQAFLLVLVVGLLFTPDLTNGMQHVLNLATIFGLLVYFARGARTPDDWYWMAVVSGVLSAVVSLCFYLQQEALPSINANAWSFLPLTAVFAVCLGFPAARARGRGQIALALLAALNGAWVFLSTSRGSFFIACVCFLVLLIQLRKARRGVVPIALAVVVALAVISQFEGKESVAVSRLNKLFDTERSLANRTSGRSDLAIAGWRLFKNNPLGIGTGGFSRARAARGTEDPSELKDAYKQAHSGWMKVLSENGVPGILLFSAFILSFALKGWRTRRRELFLLGLLVTLALSVAFLADEFQGKGLWLLAAGVMTLLRRPATREAAAAVRPAPSTAAERLVPTSVTGRGRSSWSSVLRPETMARSHASRPRTDL